MKQPTLTTMMAIILGALSAGSIANAQEKAPFRIGAIVDMTGVYSAHGGPGVVKAVEMAAKDFGGKVLDRKIEVLSADYQNKLDITAARAREWYDRDGVSMIIESTDSASALALQKLGKEKKKLTIFAGSASSSLTNENCSPYGIHYVYDTYALAHGTGAAVTQNGGSSWFFITADYAFGHSLERDTSAVVKENGGKIVGAVRAPLNTTDFSSYLLQAQTSGAKVIGLANAGTDTQTSVRQASELGITQSGQKLATLLVFLHDVKGMGLQAAQGLQFTTGFYWDRNDETRAFSKRFFKAHGTMPSMVQAGAYSATLHYLNAVKAAGSDDAGAVAEQMKKTPINDFYTHNGKIRADGRMVYDMLLAEVKKPAESTADWDLLKIQATIPADKAWRPLSESTCPLVKK
ncbi:ABC transporter substrate-binding protein [Pollutimonas sp. H1-120]|uniref:ABC transporter substrate-binding protein n=1 Tax=Pollutimonas sp. H1-120 TaxID=3148824 RepID=UPI003B52E15D